LVFALRWERRLQSRMVERTGARARIGPESHGDRRIQALLDAHHGLPHSGPNVPPVDLIELPSHRMV